MLAFCYLDHPGKVCTSAALLAKHLFTGHRMSCFTLDPHSLQMFSSGLYRNRKLLMTDKQTCSFIVCKISRLILLGGEHFSNKGPREIGEVSETKAAENYRRQTHFPKTKETDCVT